MALAAEDPVDVASSEVDERPAWFPVNGDKVSVLVFIALTVAMFALLGLAQKLVERL